MRIARGLLPALVVMVLGVTGCADVLKNGIKTRSLRGGDAVLTNADWRAINESEVQADSVHGRVNPKYIRCAEPSPDVAKAVSHSFGASLSAVISGLPGGVTPQVAAAVSRSHAEALAQLTERLATMQLLRDGLYRACEAYANGAIADTTYAVMLSRFDKTMVTMLLGELAAGGFGRSLAGATTATEASAKAALDLADKHEQTREAEATLKSAEERHAQAELTLGAATQNAAADPASPTATKTVNDAKQNLERTSKDVARAQQDVKNALKAETTSAAKALEVKTVGALTVSHTPEIARSLTELARKYLENIHFDALEVGCLSALDRPAQVEPTAFAKFCATGQLLAQLQEQKRTLLTMLVERAQADRDRARTRASVNGTVEEIRAYVQSVEALIAEILRVKEAAGAAAKPAGPSVAPAGSVKTAPAALTGGGK